MGNFLFDKEGAIAARTGKWKQVQNIQEEEKDKEVLKNINITGTLVRDKEEEKEPPLIPGVAELPEPDEEIEIPSLRGVKSQKGAYQKRLAELEEMKKKITPTKDGKEISVTEWFKDAAGDLGIPIRSNKAVVGLLGDIKEMQDVHAKKLAAATQFADEREKKLAYGIMAESIIDGIGTIITAVATKGRAEYKRGKGINWDAMAERIRKSLARDTRALDKYYERKNRLYLQYIEDAKEQGNYKYAQDMEKYRKDLGFLRAEAQDKQTKLRDIERQKFNTETAIIQDDIRVDEATARTANKAAMAEYNAKIRAKEQKARNEAQAKRDTERKQAKVQGKEERRQEAAQRRAQSRYESMTKSHTKALEKAYNAVELASISLPDKGDLEDASLEPKVINSLKAALPFLSPDGKKALKILSAEPTWTNDDAKNEAYDTLQKDFDQIRSARDQIQAGGQSRPPKDAQMTSKPQARKSWDAEFNTREEAIAAKRAGKIKKGMNIKIGNELFPVK